MAAIEGGLGDALALGNRGQLFAHGLGRLDVAAISDTLLDVCRSAAGGGERRARQVIDELRVNVLAAAKYAQPGTFRRAGDIPTHVSPATKLPAALDFL